MIEGMTGELLLMMCLRIVFPASPGGNPSSLWHSVHTIILTGNLLRSDHVNEFAELGDANGICMKRIFSWVLQSQLC